MKPGYKQTEVGVIPEEWEAAGLGRFWSVTDCKHVTAQFVREGFPIASIREVQSRFVDLTNAKQTTAKFYNLLIEGGRKPCPGDLILSRNATVGEVAQVSDWHQPFAMGQDVCLLRKKSPDHSTAFLQAVFQSPVIMNQLANLMVGSTFKRVNVEQIRNFSVSMPLPREQRAIAEALSDVDALLGALDRLIAKKRDLKQAAMQQLLTGQTRLPGFHGEWEMKTLGEITDSLDNLRVPLNEAQREKMQGDYPYCGANGILGFVDNYVIDDDIILMAEDGGYFDEYESRPIAYRMTGKCWVNNHAHILKAKPGSDQGFLFYSLVHKNILPFLASGTRAKLNKSEMNKIEVRLPNEQPEQTAIAEALTEMDAELAALEQRREKTRALKQSMMQELLTGRTRLVSPEEAHA
jgi:type I restriction enzyme S subunit